MIFNSLFPVFALIGLGFGLTRGRFLNRAIQRGLNGLAYWVGLPAVLFHRLATAETEFAESLPLLAILLGGTAACFLLALGVGLALRLPRPSLGSMTQAAFRGNLAFVALPVIVHATCGDPRLETLAILTLVPCVMVYNVVAVALLVACGPRHPDRHPLHDMGFKLITNPLMISASLGVAWNLAALPMPEALHGFLRSLSGMAFPTALIGIGSQLAMTPVRGHLREAVLATAIKNAVAPLVGYGLARLLGLSGPELLVAVLLLATPTAVTTYVMADQMRNDSGLAASAVAVSTVLSVPSFAAILWCLS